MRGYSVTHCYDLQQGTRELQQDRGLISRTREVEHSNLPYLSPRGSEVWRACGSLARSLAQSQSLSVDVTETHGLGNL